MFLLLAVVQRRALSGLGLVHKVVQVKAPRLPVIDGTSRLELVHPADHLIDRFEAEFRHVSTKALGEHHEVVDDRFRIPGKLLAKLRVLGGDAHRAGVQVAFAQHDAAHNHQCSRRHAPLFSAQ